MNALRCAVAALVALSLVGCAGRAPVPSHGSVAPGFEEVRTEFERNFQKRGEVGAALSVYHRGVKVVDLWGGTRNEKGDAWEEDTLVPVYSTTKGIAALLLALAQARGWLDYDAYVSRYWPSFAQNGKERITVRQLLSHEAGLVLLDAPLPYETVQNLDALAKVLERQVPRWEPGTRHGYHLSTLGFYMNELFRRVEPKHRSMGTFLREDVGPALQVEIHLGVPVTFDKNRVAFVETTSPMGGIAHLCDPPFPILTRLLSPWSVMTRTFAIPENYDVNDPKWWHVEMPSGNGITTARSIARLYSEFATGGRTLGMGRATLDALEAPPRDPPGGPDDVVLGLDSYYSLGFIKPSPSVEWGSSRHAYGMSGAGGSFGFADPDRHVGYAYVMNHMGYHMNDDPREKALRDAAYRGIAARERLQAQARR